MSEALLLSALSEIAESEQIFTIQDEQGIPSTENSEGEATMPFWSSAEKAQSFIQQTAGYENFQVLAIEWEVFAEKWVPGLDRDKLLAGLNWEQGGEAKGFDLMPFELLEKVEGDNE